MNKIKKDSKKKNSFGVTIFMFISLTVAMVYVYLMSDAQMYIDDDDFREAKQNQTDTKYLFRGVDRVLELAYGQKQDSQSGTSSGGNVLVGANGKLITDSSRNPYELPLYDGLTLDANKLGCKTWEVPYSNNPFLVIQSASQPGGWAVTQEHRGCEGGSASWNIYDEINYSPHAVCGLKVPSTIIDGRLSIAVPWRWAKDPDTYPFDKDAGNTAGDPSTAGYYYDVVFTDGTVLACIGGSAKGTEYDTNSKYQGYMHYNACPIEIIQYTDRPVGKPWNPGYQFGENMAKQAGIPTNGYGPNWNFIIGSKSKAIDRVVVYQVQHYTHQQGYKCWFSEQGV